MRNRIDTRLAELKQDGKHGIMAHVVVGYPDLARSERLILTLAEAGADLIELQIPFTDPLADGPTILQANLRSLKNGIRVRDCLAFAERVANKTTVPLLFMTYINIPFNYGLERFCRDSSAAGIQGLIVPDIPPEEHHEAYRELALGSGLHPVLILSPSSTEERIALIAAQASGFLYCTARVGITGARSGAYRGLEGFMGEVRKHTALPLALGFGISSQEQVQAASRLAEVSIIGSKVIDLYNQAGEDENAALAGVREFLRGLRIE